MFIGSNKEYICPFLIESQVKFARIGNLKFLINVDAGKSSKFNKRGGPNKSVEGRKITWAPK